MIALYLDDARDFHAFQFALVLFIRRFEVVAGGFLQQSGNWVDTHYHNSHLCVARAPG
jgi:hypothetical protein